MAKTSKRVWSVLLTLVMILGLLPTSVFATWDNQIMDGYFAVDQDGEYTEVEDGSVTSQGYTVSKTIDQTGENAFNITLNVETSETVTTNDAAVVLVIDVSNSMTYCAECGGSSRHDKDCSKYNHWDNSVKNSDSRMVAARTAAKKFVDSLVENNEGGNIYVSVVGFKSYAYKACDWTDVTEANGAKVVENAINGLTTNGEDDYGGTNLEAGLMLARNRLGMKDISSASAKYTVLLTDGEPTFRVERENNSTEYAGTNQTGGNNSDGFWTWGGYDSGGTNCSKAERTEAVSMAEKVKELSQLYTICYAVGNETLYDSVTMSQYLENEIATTATSDVTYAFDAENTEQLNAAFKDIASSVSDGSTGAGTRVVDPMGQFINFGQVDEKSVEGGTYSYDPTSKTLTWTLDPDTAQKEQEGNKTTYKFKLTYSITLDTAAEGFKETEPVTVEGETQEVTKYYPTNGYTSLKVPGKDDVVFNVPGVCGEIPEYGYTVEYYLQGDANKGEYENYTQDDKDSYGPVDLHSKVDINDIVAN